MPQVETTRVLNTIKKSSCVTVDPDIYHLEKKYAASLPLLKNDRDSLNQNKDEVLNSREVNGLDRQDLEAR